VFARRAEATEQTLTPVIVLMPCGFDLARTRKEAMLLRGYPGWQDLPAVRDGQVWAANG